MRDWFTHEGMSEDSFINVRKQDTEITFEQVYLKTEVTDPECK